MTIAELITALQSHDPNALVVVIPFEHEAIFPLASAPRATTVVRDRGPGWFGYHRGSGAPISAVVLFDIEVG